jgi:Matrixin
MRGSVLDLRVCCLVLCVVALVSALGMTSPKRASAWCRTTTETPLTGSDCIHEGLPLSWNRQCISFTVEDPGESGPALEAVRDAADRSFTAWSSVQCNGRPIGLELRQTRQLAECGVAQHDRQGPNMNAILFVEDWNDQDDLPPDAFAVTLVWNLVKTGEIVDADMLVNPTLGQLTICGDTCPRSPVVVDVQNVITHEAGHFLGLAHSAEFDATMSSTAPVGETKKRTLEPDDAEGLCSIYGQLPAAQCDEDSGDYVPPRGFSARCSSPRQSSCTLGVPGDRRPSGLALGLGLLAVAIWLARRR